MTAPIVLFVCARPEQTARCLEALAANDGARDSELIVFADGPPTPALRDEVAAVRGLARAARGFARCTVVERPVNVGLFRSVTDGLQQVAQQHERFIVLEDDLVTSPHFLRYMNDALGLFAATPRVGSIHGYVYPIPSLPEYFFVHGGDCWGWATWSDRWRLFNPDARALLRALRTRDRLREFEAPGGVRLTKLLIDRALERRQSWAILWHASLVLHDCLTLMPGQTFVNNVGADRAATHGRLPAAYNGALRTSYEGIRVGELRADEEAMRRMRDFLAPLEKRGRWAQGASTLYTRVLGRLLA